MMSAGARPPKAHPSIDPRTEMTIRTGHDTAKGILVPRCISGWALRLVLAVAAVGATAVVLMGAPQLTALSMPGVAFIAVALLAALAPGTVIPLLLLVGLVLGRLAAPGPAVDMGLVLLVALIPLIHQLAGITAAIPMRSICQWRALRPAAWRYVIAVGPVECALIVALTVA